MPDIKISVINRAVKADKTLYICGNSDFRLLFDFDHEWDDYEVKTARFARASGFDDVVFIGNECPVPIISDTHYFYIGVYAGDLRTTIPARVDCKRSILCGSGLPEPPPPDVYARIIDMLNDCLEVADRAEQFRDEADQRASDSEEAATASATSARAAADAATAAAKSESNAADSAQKAKDSCDQVLAALDSKISEPEKEGTNGQVLVTDGNGGRHWENPGTSFTTDETLTLKEGVLSVNRALSAEQDNTLPITSAAVAATVGNIKILLETI